MKQQRTYHVQRHSSSHTATTPIDQESMYADQQVEFEADSSDSDRAIDENYFTNNNRAKISMVKPNRGGEKLIESSAAKDNKKTEENYETFDQSINNLNALKIHTNEDKFPAFQQTLNDFHNTISSDRVNNEVCPNKSMQMTFGPASNMELSNKPQSRNITTEFSSPTMASSPLIRVPQPKIKKHKSLIFKPLNTT